MRVGYRGLTILLHLNKLIKKEKDTHKVIRGYLKTKKVFTFWHVIQLTMSTLET